MNPAVPPVTRRDFLRSTTVAAAAALLGPFSGLSRTGEVVAAARRILLCAPGVVNQVIADLAGVTDTCAVPAAPVLSATLQHRPIRATAIVIKAISTLCDPQGCAENGVPSLGRVRSDLELFRDGVDAQQLLRNPEVRATFLQAFPRPTFRTSVTEEARFAGAMQRYLGEHRHFVQRSVPAQFQALAGNAKVAFPGPCWGKDLLQAAAEGTLRKELETPAATALNEYYLDAQEALSQLEQGRVAPEAIRRADEAAQKLRESGVEVPDWRSEAQHIIRETEQEGDHAAVYLARYERRLWQSEGCFDGVSRDILAQCRASQSRWQAVQTAAKALSLNA